MAHGLSQMSKCQNTPSIAIQQQQLSIILLFLVECCLPTALTVPTQLYSMASND